MAAFFNNNEQINMYYLIDKTTKQVIEEHKNKTRLRKIKLKKENPENYMVSKSNTLDKEEKKKIIKEKVLREKRTKEDGTRERGFSAEFSPEEIIEMQTLINEKRKKAGLKVIVEIPTKEEIIKRRNRGFDIVAIEERSKEFQRKITKYGFIMKIDGEDVINCNDRRVIREARKNRKSYLKENNFTSLLNKIQ